MSGTEAILAALAVALLTMVFAASVVARVLLLRSGVYPMPSGRNEGGPVASREREFLRATAPLHERDGASQFVERREDRAVHECSDSLNIIAHHLEKSGEFPPARVCIGLRDPSKRLDPRGAA